MSRSEVQKYACGLFPRQRVVLDCDKFTKRILVDLVEVASGATWEEAYGDMRRRHDAKREEEIRQQVIAAAEGTGEVAGA